LGSLAYGEHADVKIIKIGPANRWKSRFEVLMFFGQNLVSDSKTGFARIFPRRPIGLALGLGTSANGEDDTKRIIQIRRANRWTFWSEVGYFSAKSEPKIIDFLE